MNNNIDVTELKKLSLKFRTVASRLLRTNYADGMSNLKRFLNLIDNQPVIKNLIDMCSCKFDVETEVKTCASEYRMIYSIPTESEQEISFVYQILKYYSENYDDYLTPIPHAYCFDSSMQKQVDEFNNRVVMPFVNHINSFIEEQYIEAGNSALTNPITINNQSGQINLAQDHANITATQNINTEVISLIEKFMAQLQSENQEELKELLETVLDSVKNNSPKKTIIGMLSAKIREVITLSGVSVCAIETAEKLLPVLDKFFNKS
jgi:hypothetical protein